MPLIKEEIVHVKGFPKKLVIFLHGYIDNAENIEKLIMPIMEKLDNIAIHIPEAPHICEIYESKRQWYSMHRFDPNDDRKFVETLKECIGIYNKMGLGISEADAYFEEYVEQCLSEYGLEDKDLFICGFSQGATLAIYSALSRENKIGGCVSFNGVVAPGKFLVKHHLNTPDTLLIHGTDDNLVRFDLMDYSKQTMQEMGAKVETLVIKNGQHRITDDGVKLMLNFIKKRI